MFLSERGKLFCECGNSNFKIFIDKFASKTYMMVKCMDCMTIVEYKEDKFDTVGEARRA